MTDGAITILAWIGGGFFALYLLARWEGRAADAVRNVVYKGIIAIVVLGSLSQCVSGRGHDYVTERYDLGDGH